MAERSTRRHDRAHPQCADAQEVEGVYAHVAAARERARCAQGEGFIRGYASVEHSNGRNEIEIELKYLDGAPVIREISRVSKPGRRVYASVKAVRGSTMASASRSCRRRKA